MAVFQALFQAEGGIGVNFHEYWIWSRQRLATENLWPSESSSLHQILLERKFRCLLEIPISREKVGDLFLTFPTCEIVYIKNVHLLS